MLSEVTYRMETLLSSQKKKSRPNLTAYTMIVGSLKGNATLSEFNHDNFVCRNSPHALYPIFLVCIYYRM